MELVGPGAPFAAQKIVSALPQDQPAIQKLGSKQQQVHRDAIQQLLKDLMCEERLLHVLKVVRVKELTWHDIEFAVCEFRKLLVGGRSLKE